ncbi:hypothetical protein [Kribbella sp. C-35]|uniref:hypothetical protein n=1 Tax=Kribbella sp. C-35 TaxID=2789276 RepID=UPI00397C2CDE
MNTWSLNIGFDLSHVQVRPWSVDFRIVAAGTSLKSSARSWTARYIVSPTHTIPVGFRLYPAPLQTDPTWSPREIVAPDKFPGVPVISLTAMSAKSPSRLNPLPSPFRKPAAGEQAKPHAS